MYANGQVVYQNKPVIVRQMPQIANAQTITTQDITPKVIYPSKNSQVLLKPKQVAPVTLTMYREPSEEPSYKRDASVLEQPSKKTVRTLPQQDDDFNDAESELGSTISEKARNSRKLLSGFHPFYDKVNFLLMSLYFIQVL